MTNHAHLLVTPREPESLPRAMQSLGRRYVRHVNALYRRTGTLREGRYRPGSRLRSRSCPRAATAVRSAKPTAPL